MAAIAAAAALIEPDEGIGLRAGTDVTGAVMVTAGLMLGVGAIVGITRYGWACGAAGVAVAATLATWRTGVLRAAGRLATPALAAGYHLAFGVAAGLIAAALAVAAAVLTPGRRPRDLPPRPRTPEGCATARDSCCPACPR